MDDRSLKVDLHVHSRCSDNLKIPILEYAKARECYVSPEDLYQRARARGMDLVTITDHDSIQGCLEIARHGPHVFLSEEVSARFPDDGCVVHVLALGLTEAQHDEIQRLRSNIYDLARYLRQARVCHSVAHLLSPVNGRLRREHLEQCLLLFENVEVLNASRHAYHRRALTALLDGITPEHIERWADRYGIDPVAREPWWGRTGGSDDHSGIAIARAYTEFQGSASLEGLTRALEARRAAPRGESLSAVSFAHQVCTVTGQYFLDAKAAQGRNSIFEQLVRVVGSGGAALADPGSLHEVTRPWVARVASALQRTGQTMEIPAWDRVVREGAGEAIHRQVNEVVREVARHALTGAVEELVAAVSRLEFDQVIALLAGIGHMLFLQLPYCLALRYVYQDRRDAESLHDALGIGHVRDESPAVAIFTDTPESVDGAGIGLQQMARELRAQGKRVYLVALEMDTASGAGERSGCPSDDGETAVRFKPLATFGIPGQGAGDLAPESAYRHRFGIPPLLEMLQWFVEHEIDLVHVSTPGPVGAAGLLIAKLLGSPVAGHYHPDLPEYAGRLLGDESVARAVGAYAGWFYNAVDRIIAPSGAACDRLAAMGIARDRIHQLSRRVDSRLFTPERRNDRSWTRYGLDGSTKLLYVGRLSRENDLDVLLEGFLALRQEGLDVSLGIVGDGPYRQELTRRAAAIPEIVLTGYVAEDELADLYASADIFVFPGGIETHGNAILEAEASALPAVVTDRGGSSRLVVHDQTGFVVPAGDGRALAAAIRRLVADQALRQQMASAGRRHAVALTRTAAADALWDCCQRHIEQDRLERRQAVNGG